MSPRVGREGCFFSANYAGIRMATGILTAAVSSDARAGFSLQIMPEFPKIIPYLCGRSDARAGFPIGAGGVVCV